MSLVSKACQQLNIWFCMAWLATMHLSARLHLLQPQLIRAELYLGVDGLGHGEEGQREVCEGIAVAL